MKRLLLLLSMCFLFTACGGGVEIDPESATGMNLTMFEDRIKPDYTIREVYQMPLGEDYGERPLEFKADGVLIGALSDGPRAEGKPVVMYRGPNNGRIAWLTTSPAAAGRPKDSVTYGQFKTAKAFYRFLEDQR